MPHPNRGEDCTCDYSYTCNGCRKLYAQENARDYANEKHEWLMECVKLIAQKLGVELPPEPEKRDTEGW